MRKIIIFGNSGSGKSTLAKELCAAEALSHLDLDTLAWQPTSPPVRRPLDESEGAITDFAASHEGWVIEGCYADLLELAGTYSTEIIFMDLPVSDCIENARSRPWEPHKYESLEAQDANLEMLVEWIARYPERTDACSEKAHRALFQEYPGKKVTITNNQR